MTVMQRCDIDFLRGWVGYRERCLCRPQERHQGKRLGAGQALQKGGPTPRCLQHFGRFGAVAPGADEEHAALSENRRVGKSRGGISIEVKARTSKLADQLRS